jgi:hypothetical protein
MSKARSARRGFVAVAVLLCASGCASASSGESADRELFDSVADLARHSTVVVHGRVGSELTTETDDSGTRFTFFGLDDAAVLGGAAASEPFIVLSYDGSPDAGYGGPNLAAGEDVVLFLAAASNDEDDAVETQESWYEVIGGDQGVFVVDGDDVAPRLDTDDRTLPDTLADLSAEVDDSDVGSRVGRIG